MLDLTAVLSFSSVLVFLPHTTLFPFSLPFLLLPFFLLLPCPIPPPSHPPSPPPLPSISLFSLPLFFLPSFLPLFFRLTPLCIFLSLPPSLLSPSPLFSLSLPGSPPPSQTEAPLLLSLYLDTEHRGLASAA